MRTKLAFIRLAILLIVTALLVLLPAAAALAQRSSWVV